MSILKTELDSGIETFEKKTLYILNLKSEWIFIILLFEINAKNVYQNIAFLSSKLTKNALKF